MLEYSLIELYGNERRWFVGFHFTYLGVGGVRLYLKDNRSTISKPEEWVGEYNGDASEIQSIKVRMSSSNKQSAQNIRC